MGRLPILLGGGSLHHLHLVVFLKSYEQGGLDITIAILYSCYMVRGSMRGLSTP